MNYKSRTVLVLILGLSVLLRLGMAFYLGDDVKNLPGTADQLSYHTLALRVLDGHGFTFGEPWWPATQADAPTAHWSFLYTGYLILIYAVTNPVPLAARLVQALVVGLLQPFLAYLIGRRLFGDMAGLAAALLTAVYAYFIYYSANLMTEPFYITAILLSLYLAMKIARPDKAALNSVKSPVQLEWMFFLGVALGAAVLLRQLFLLIVPVILLWLWLALAGRPRRLLGLGLAAGVIALMIVPFTIYNYARFDRFVLLNTNAGYAFFWGNHPIYGDQFQSILPEEMGSYADLIPDDVYGLDEAAMDQELLRRGIGFITGDPARYVMLSLSRIPSYFMFWPTEDSGLLSNAARVLSFGLLWPFMLYGIVLAVSRTPALLRLRPPSPLLLLLGFALVYTLIHVLTWTLIRYRLPVDAVLLVFGGLAVADIVERIPVLRRLVHTALESYV